MSDVVTVFHPVLPDVSNDVPKGDVEAWVAQGWRKSKPKAAKTEAAAAKKAAGPRRRARKATHAAPAPVVKDAPKASE